MNERLSRRHVVLIGVGHTNAHLVRMWRMNAPPDTDLTCISNFPVVTYSGMLPAVLAQQVPRDQMEIDLVRLCNSVSARLITDPVIGIDHSSREIRFEARPNIPFDFLSIGIGSIPSFDDVQVESDSLVRIKPMQTFLQRMRTTLEAREKIEGKDHLDVVIVGSGVAGVEVTLCLPPFIHSVSRLPCKLRIVTRSEMVVPDLEPRTRRLLTDELDRRRVSVTAGTAVKRILRDSVVLDDGTRVPADLVIWATGAAPPPLLTRLGLALDPRGFLETDRTLQSTSMKGVFAVGDTGSMKGEPVPKAGVYAVRQGPVLWDNLHRFLEGKPLKEYKPQRSFLKLINLGDGRAVGQWKRIAFAGHWAMKLKHHIDTSFMDMFRVEDSMLDDNASNGTANELAMQCRGCGCKLGTDVLTAGLGLGQGAKFEDAAVIDSDETGSSIASTDFFSSPLPDPFLAGRVAALHSASDVIVSGGIPSSALANVVLPPGDPNSQQRALSDLLAGARQEFTAMGASLVGGHTIVGPRMELGFTVIGKSLGRKLIRKGNLQVGDRLVLTKPIGTGVLLAAHMQSRCSAEHYQQLLARMLERQHPWTQVTNDCNIEAGTDITGFGLAGHLLEMLQSSEVAAVIDLDAVPCLPGAVEAIGSGIESTLAPSNRCADASIEASEGLRKRPQYDLLFDPQTCGGLLFGVPEERLSRLFEAAEAAGLSTPVTIGEIVTQQDARIRVASGEL